IRLLTASGASQPRSRTKYWPSVLRSMRSRCRTATNALRWMRTKSGASSSSSARSESSIRSSPRRWRTVVYFWSAKKYCTSSRGIRRSPSRWRAAMCVRRSAFAAVARRCSWGRVRRPACVRAAASFSLRIGLSRYPTARVSKAFTAYWSYAVVKITAGGSSRVLKCLAASIPSMPGMRTSSSTRSGESVVAWSSASVPLPASPTTSASPISASRLRSRSRAGGSSSTISTLSMRSLRLPSLLARTHMREAQRHDVLIAEAARLHQGQLAVEQRQPLANVGQRQPVAFALALALRHGVADDYGDEVARELAHDAHRSARAPWLDAVIDRILDERLQQQAGYP